MKICVYGMHHQGPVTAACLAELGLQVLGIDDDAANVARLAGGRAPLFEPGLDELLAAGLAAGRLSFGTDLAAAASQTQLVWIAFDTPVDDDDRADVEYVKNRVRACFPHLSTGTTVHLSSQLPIGSTGELERSFAAQARGRKVHFACCPENLRLGKSLEAFRRADRLVVGVRCAAARRTLEPVLSRLTSRLIWTSIESAEMTKHATNAFLAASIGLINEIATLCEQTGADAAEVEAGLRAEPRIGPHAYVRPGAPFAGGTLARDILYLQQIAEARGLQSPLLGGVLSSNNAHRLWALRQLRARLGDLRGRTIGVLGLSYKPQTDSVRRSVAVELCRELAGAGARVQAFDPKVTSLPSGLHDVRLAGSALEAAAGAEALVVATEWPEFRDLDIPALAKVMRGPLVLDQGRFLERSFAAAHALRYVTVGRPL